MPFWKALYLSIDEHTGLTCSNNALSEPTFVISNASDSVAHSASFWLSLSTCFYLM